MDNVSNHTEQRQTETYTTGGQLVRLVLDLDTGDFIGAVTISAACPWVYRRPYLVTTDVD